MNYKELLLSTGGGIIDKNRLAEYSGEPTLFIGLGGTGIDCLKEVKKAVFNRIKPDDLHSPRIEYTNVQFLGIDSNSMSVSGNGMEFDLDRTTEFFDLSCPDIKAPLKAPLSKSLYWLNKDLIIFEPSCGSGAVRQIGRLLLFLKIEQFINALFQKIRMTCRDNTKRKINVHIFTGVSGGTGSGIFLDVCYILQRVLDDNGFSGGANLFGYCFLPEVNFNKVNFPSERVKNYLRVNAYAFMKELDYCMDYQGNGGEWNQHYTNWMKIKSKKSPIDLAFIIDGKNESVEIHVNSYNYAISVVADFIIRQMTIAQDEMRFASYVFPHNGNLKYLTLGVAGVRVPIREIYTYCASKILLELDENISGSSININAFVNENGLRYDDILAELQRGIPNVPMIEVNNGQLLQEIQGITSPDIIPSMLVPMRDIIPRISDTVRNKSEDVLEKILYRIKNGLKNITLSSAQGIFFAEEILKTNSKNRYDLIHVLDGYLRSNEERIKCKKSEFELVNAQVAELLNAMKNRRLGLRARSQAYVSLVHKHFLIHAQIVIYTEMDELIHKLIAGVNRLNEEKFAQIGKVLNDLRETAEHNLRFFSTIADVGDDYRNNIINDNIVCDICDSYLEQLDTKRAILGLVNRLVKYVENYGDSTDITRSVSEYFSQVFADLVNLSIEEYLRMRYNTDSEILLTRTICDDMLTTLARKSTPLLCTEMTLNPCVSIEMCYAPSSSVLLLNALSDFRQMHNNIIITKSYELDSLTYIQIKPCESILVNYSNREQYKNAYDNHSWKGAHLYEDGAC